MRIAALLALSWATSMVLFAQPRASVSYASFEAAEQPYVELYITVERASLVTPDAGRPAAEFTIVFQEGDRIVAADKVELLAPASDSVRNFVEALRYPLPNGSYELSVTGVDVHAAASVDTPPLLRLRSPVEVAFDRARVRLSDIQLATEALPLDAANANSILAKGDRFLEPLPQNFVRRGQAGFTAYVEVYAPQDAYGVAHVLEYAILDLDADPEAPTELVRKTKRFTPGDAVTPFFTRIGTAALRSGNYALRMIVRDRELQEVSKRITLLTVSNPARDVVALGEPQVGYEESWVHELDTDSLRYALQAILPTLPGPEVEYVNEVIKREEPDAMRLALYNHYLGESAVLPELAYDTYMRVARQIDFEFHSGFGHGFQTDRGHIFLKYGKPNDRIIVNDDPSAPPYEIWVYEWIELTAQGPGKFLFYNQTLDNANYVLLHSTVRGEIVEPQWRRYLYARAAEEFGDVDQVQGTDVADNVGRYADQYFTDF